MRFAPYVGIIPLYETAVLRQRGAVVAAGTAGARAAGDAAVRTPCAARGFRGVVPPG